MLLARLQDELYLFGSGLLSGGYGGKAVTTVQEHHDRNFVLVKELGVAVHMVRVKAENQGKGGWWNEPWNVEST